MPYKSLPKRNGFGQSEPIGQVLRPKEILAVANGAAYTQAAQRPGRRYADPISRRIERFHREWIAAIQPRHGGEVRCRRAGSAAACWAASRTTSCHECRITSHARESAPPSSGRVVGDQPRTNSGDAARGRLPLAEIAHWVTDRAADTQTEMGHRGGDRRGCGSKKNGLRRCIEKAKAYAPRCGRKMKRGRVRACPTRAKSESRPASSSGARVDMEWDSPNADPVPRGQGKRVQPMDECSLASWIQQQTAGVLKTLPQKPVLDEVDNRQARKARQSALSVSITLPSPDLGRPEGTFHSRPHVVSYSPAN